MKIQNTGDIKNNKLNVLVYGPPGSGKTMFCGTSAKKFKPLILSAESGLLSLNAIGKFDFVQIDKFADLVEAKEFLLFGKHNYDTVIMDSVTEIQQVCMRDILKENNRSQSQQSDWGTLNTRMTWMIREFRDSKLNFVATALLNVVQDSEQKERFGPSLQGALASQIAAYFDEVFFLFTKEDKDKDGNTVVKRALQTQGTLKYTAKDRSGKLAMLVKPDFCELYETIFGTKENTK